jgi:4-hydroxybenzoate polyprenyltransferase
MGLSSDAIAAHSVETGHDRAGDALCSRRFWSDCWCHQFSRFTVVTGLASLIVVAFILSQRITYWPQIFLGLAFSWGAMGWRLNSARLDWPRARVYAGSICWVIGYDTIYATGSR